MELQKIIHKLELEQDTIINDMINNWYGQEAIDALERVSASLAKLIDELKIENENNSK